MKKIQELLNFLIKSPLDFVLVGGFAAVLHGSNQATRDLDICVLLSGENFEHLRSVLKPINPRLRNLPEKPSFIDHSEVIKNLGMFHLDTDLGELDLLSHIKGVGNYYAVLKNSEEIDFYGQKCRVISIDDLIKTKKALGGHKDLLVVDELLAIKKEREH